MMIEPAHISVTDEASPVGQEHEGSNWFEGGVHCVAQESKHYFIIMWGMAEGEAIVVYREGVCVCSKDLVLAVRAGVSVVGVIKFKRVGEPLLRPCTIYIGLIECGEV
eukprot:1162055-Pelagomonas_calceolata.AAC.1